MDTPAAPARPSMFFTNFLLAILIAVAGYLAVMEWRRENARSTYQQWLSERDTTGPDVWNGIRSEWGPYWESHGLPLPPPRR